MKISKIQLSLSLILAFCVFGCKTSDVKDAIDTGQELADGVDRKPIPRELLGINAFVNDSRFGSISQQFSEVRSTLSISHVRILFNWDDLVQPSSGSAINFSFYDSIVSSLPQGVDALAVVTGLPSWMADSSNWLDGNPRTTFVEKFVKEIVSRYKDRNRLIAWQVWNEPNMDSNSNNQIMGLADSPENYVELLARAHSTIKSLAPGDLVVNAATTAINQNFPDSLDYNKRMVAAGINGFCDRYAIHYYGRQFENLIRPGGVAEFLNANVGELWVTESGAQGTDKQLAYGEQVWPYLQEKLTGLTRIYIYQFAEDTSADATYGLKNPSATQPVSDLYLSLSGA